MAESAQSVHEESGAGVERRRVGEAYAGPIATDQILRETIASQAGQSRVLSDAEAAGMMAAHRGDGLVSLAAAAESVAWSDSVPPPSSSGLPSWIVPQVGGKADETPTEDWSRARGVRFSSPEEHDLFHEMIAEIDRLNSRNFQIRSEVLRATTREANLEVSIRRLNAENGLLRAEIARLTAEPESEPAPAPRRIIRLDAVT